MTEYLLMFLFFCIFQLTSSRRGWRSTAYAGVNSTLFQLTSSRRGWHWTSSGSELDIPFQLTSSRRGWHAHSPLLTVQGCHFNSHPHEEDDPASWIPRSSYRHFNSHPHEEDDFHSFVLSVIVILFQLTSSRRGWPFYITLSNTSNYFNSHPHEEDDRKCLIFYFKTEIFQLTSSRRGWQYTLYFLFNCVNISTHILTKRMTIVGSIKKDSELISTHILTKRMTMDKLDMFKQTGISTHILTKRMTNFHGDDELFTGYFNSHPHEEDDVKPCFVEWQHIHFNSHPHEEDDEYRQACFGS